MNNNGVPASDRSVNASPSWCDKAGKKHVGHVREKIHMDSAINARAAPFEPRDQSYGDTSMTTGKSSNYSIGQNLWRQLKRVQLPVFSGDKKNYQSWEAAFLACIDNTPATAELIFRTFQLIERNSCLCASGAQQNCSVLALCRVYWFFMHG